MADHNLIIPFLNNDPIYCYGVELGMSVLAPMFAGQAEISGYFRTENEEQIRLCCHRKGYEVEELKPWKFKRKDTGWVWMKLTKQEINDE